MKPDPELERLLAEEAVISDRYNRAALGIHGWVLVCPEESVMLRARGTVPGRWGTYKVDQYERLRERILEKHLDGDSDPGVA